MSVATTLAPAFAKASAEARPMPWAAAVTTTVLPVRFSVMERFLRLAGLGDGGSKHVLPLSARQWAGLVNHLA